MLVRREALERAGGIAVDPRRDHRRLRPGAQLKAQGPIWLGLTRRARSLRPYDGLGEIGRMVSRSAYAQLDYSPLLLAGTVPAWRWTYLVPAAAGAVRPRAGASGRARGLAADGHRLPADAALLSPSRRSGASPCRRSPRPIRLFTVQSALAVWRGRGGHVEGPRPGADGRVVTDAADLRIRQGPSRRELPGRVLADPAASSARRSSPSIASRAPPTTSPTIRDAAARPRSSRSSHGMRSGAARRRRQRGRRGPARCPSGARPHRPARARSSGGLPPRRHQEALRRLGRPHGLLPLFRRAGRPLRAGPARRSAGAVAGQRCALHRAAGDQPPAGLRQGSSRRSIASTPARRAGGAGRHRRRPCGATRPRRRCGGPSKASPAAPPACSTNRAASPLRSPIAGWPWRSAPIQALAEDLTARLTRRDPLSQRVHHRRDGSRRRLPARRLQGRDRSASGMTADADDAAAAGAGLAAARSTPPCASCPRPSARRCSPSTASAGWSTTSPTTAREPRPQRARRARRLARRSRRALRRPAGRARRLPRASPCTRFGLRQADFLAVIDGMAHGCRRGHPRARPRRRSISTAIAWPPPSAACRPRIFGMDEEPGLELAHELGRALQLTNILRDLDEDAEMGRLYLPGELLPQAGIATTDPNAAIADPRVDGACRALAAARSSTSRRPTGCCARGRAGGCCAPKLMEAVYRADPEGHAGAGLGAAAPSRTHRQAAPSVDRRAMHACWDEPHVMWSAPDWRACRPR